MSDNVLFQPKHVDAALREFIEAAGRPASLVVPWSITVAFTPLRQRDVKRWARRRGVRVTFEKDGAT